MSHFLFQWIYFVPLEIMYNPEHVPETDESGFFFNVISIVLYIVYLTSHATLIMMSNLLENVIQSADAVCITIS